MRRRPGIAIGMAAALVAALLTPSAGAGSSAAYAAAGSGVTYSYDALGRLKTVTQGGVTATYTYDAVGNIMSVTQGAMAPKRAAGRPPAAAPTPQISGVQATASTVRVSGSGFSADSNLDLVRVGGVFATVGEASSRLLVVDRPEGSVGSAVEVHVPGGTARSKLPAGTRAGASPAGPEPTFSSQAPTSDGPSASTGSGQSTALTGVVKSVDGTALAGVTLTIGNVTATTDGTGHFVLRGAPAGHDKLVIDAVNAAGGDHGRYEQGVDIVAGRVTHIPWTTWLPLIDNAHAVAIPSTVTQPIIVTSPTIPGLKVIVPVGTTITGADGNAVHALSITKIPLNRQPFPGAPGMPLAWTIQPGGASVTGPGLQVEYPNVTNQPAGTPIDYVDHDADRLGQGWAVYGRGTVSDDGKSITPDATTRLSETYLLGVSYSPLCQLLGIFCPSAGNNSSDGDPVDLSTGLFVMSKTDLGLPDYTPVALTRTYRQNDDVVRTFGIGQSDPFNMFIAPDRAGNYVLQLPSGSDIPFTPGTDGIYRALTTPTAFFGATLQVVSERDFTVTMQDGSTYTFGTETASLTSQSDRYGNVTTYSRNQSTGQLQQVTSPNGRWMKFTWGPCATSSCIARAQDNIGRSVVYGYDGSARLTSVTDLNGAKTTYGWAACTNSLTCTQITAVTDPRNITYLTNAFDANGRVASQTQADGGSYTFSYTLGTSGAVTGTNVTDPTGVVHALGFNASGYTTSEVAASGTTLQQASAITRQAGNNLVSNITDPFGRQTAYSYDATGNVLTQTRLAGTSSAVTVSYSYEPKFHRIATVTNALGNISSFAYDDVAGTITTTDPLGHSAITTTIHGQPVSLADPLGNTTYLSYLYGDLVAVADPLGRVATAYFDGAGRVLQRADPAGAVTASTYDNMNQVLGRTDPLGGVSSATYDADGNMLTTTDANGHTTTYGYNTMNQLTAQTDALGKATTAGYDKVGRPVTVTDRNGAVTQTRYDALRRPTFTGFGAVTSGGTTTYASTVTDQYDAANRLTQIVDSSGGTINQTFDGLNRLISQTTPQGNVTYGYDASGQESAMTVAGQAPVTYTYDGGNRLTKVTQGSSVASLAYDSADRRTKLTLPDGIGQSYSYDIASELSKITYASGGTSLGGLTYTYDGAGRRITMGGSYARTTTPASITAAAYNADNELTSQGSAALTYDNNGQLITDGTNTYSWNPRGQLASMSGPTNASFAYDAFGRRTNVTTGGQSTGYLYDGSNIVEQLVGTTPSATSLTGLRTDETFQRTDSTGARSFLTDALGSTIGLADSTGSVQTSYNYDPFGKATTTGQANANPVQYAGREADPTGLNYNRARYYSPTLQRFISQDPMGSAGSGSNLYKYGGDSPTNFTDPSGTQLLAGCIGGALFNVGFSWITHALSGRKYTWQQGLGDAAVGCVTGAVGAWLGDLLKGAEGLTAAESEVPQILANQEAGNAARDVIAAQYSGAETEITFQTELGARRVDVLTQEGLAIESKVGYTSLTQSIQTQIAKDQLLLANGDVAGLQWVFSASEVTGQVGPSGPLAAALEKAGIPWIIQP